MPTRVRMRPHSYCYIGFEVSSCDPIGRTNKGKGKSSTTPAAKGKKRGTKGLCLSGRYSQRHHCLSGLWFAPPLATASHSEDGWLTARQSKVRRVESPAASEEGMSEGSTPPDVLNWTGKGAKTSSA